MEQIIDIKKTPKKRLVDLLQGVPNSDNHFVLKDNGHFLGVVISRENYEKYMVQHQVEAQEKLDKFFDEVQAGNHLAMSDDELEQEIADAIHEMRGVK